MLSIILNPVRNLNPTRIPIRLFKYCFVFDCFSERCNSIRINGTGFDLNKSQIVCKGLTIFSILVYMSDII